MRVAFVSCMQAGGLCFGKLEAIWSHMSNIHFWVNLVGVEKIFHLFSEVAEIRKAHTAFSLKFLTINSNFRGKISKENFNENFLVVLCVLNYTQLSNINYCPQCRTNTLRIPSLNAFRTELKKLLANCW